MNFVSDFIKSTEGLGSPELWRRWCALTALSGAMERRYWITTSKGVLYPNLYTLLLGEPGGGKSLPLTHVERLWRSGGFSVAPAKITRAAMEDHLLDKGVRIEGYSSALCASREFSVMLPEWDNDILGFLTDLYDAPDMYEARTRMHGEKLIIKPHVTFLGATTPDSLAAVLPKAAFGMGTMSRIIMVYSDPEPVKPKLFGALHPPALPPDALKYLRNAPPREIAITEEAGAVIDAGNEADWPPTPQHPKLAHYCSRRTTHIIKLSMVLCAAEGVPQLILPRHVHLAREVLLETELRMPSVFSKLLRGGHADAAEDALAWLRNRAAALGRSVNEMEFWAYFRGRMPDRDIPSAIESLVRGGLIIKHNDAISGILSVSYSPAKQPQAA